DHASGVNAIHALSYLIPKVEAITDYANGITASVGIVSGGTAKNTVPEQAEITIDTRFETAAAAAEVVAKLEALVADPFAGCQGFPARLRSATFELVGGVTRPPMEPSAGNQALRRAYEPHASAAGLKIGAAPLQGGGSDANLLAGLGVACIDGLGPYGKYYHRVQEWSSLTSLRQRTQALASYLAAELEGLSANGPRNREQAV
ncbi:MAG: peptidase dimerization domain-containing protein, partial [Nannocystaceae bacterium]